MRLDAIPSESLLEIILRHALLGKNFEHAQLLEDLGDVDLFLKVPVAFKKNALSLVHLTAASAV